MPEILVKRIESNKSIWIEIEEWQDAEEIEAIILSSDIFSDDLSEQEWKIEEDKGFYDINLKDLGLSEIVEIAHMIIKHGEAWAAYYCNFNNSDEAQFEECYIGKYDSDIDFVKKNLESDGTLDQLEKAGLLAIYIDWEKMAKDWFIGDYVSLDAEDGDVFIFVNT